MKRFRLALALLLAGCVAAPPRVATSGAEIAPDRIYFISDSAPPLSTVRRAIDAAIAGDDARLAYVISLIRYADGEGGENYGLVLSDLEHAVTSQRFSHVLAGFDAQTQQIVRGCMAIGREMRKYSREARPNCCTSRRCPQFWGA